MNKSVWLAALSAAMLASSAWAGGDPAAGKEKSAVCAGCHGADGNAQIGTNPNLGGQYESYLYHALKAYKSGTRKDAIMGSMVAGLNDQDMRDLAAWFSSQSNGKLSVLPME